MDDLNRELQELIAGMTPDAGEACRVIASVARQMMDAFLDAGFDRDEAYGLLMVLWQNGVTEDA
ncbi:MAG: hypothetical protein ABIJ75_05990 [Actinomycetota bacterium]